MKRKCGTPNNLCGTRRNATEGGQEGGLVWWRTVMVVVGGGRQVVVRINKHQTTTSSHVGSWGVVWPRGLPARKCQQWFARIPPGLECSSVYRIILVRSRSERQPAVTPVPM